jgi:CRP-like cAMP-binding protein
MTSEEAARFLGAVPYFQGLSTAELATIAGLCRRRVLQHGDSIVLEGDLADGLYLIRRGSVRVYKASPEGKEQVLIVLHPGDTFNDVPVFDGGTNPASAVAAASDTEIWMLPTALTLRLLETSPLVAMNAVRVLATRLRHLAGLVEDLSLRQILQRVARLLLEEAERTGGDITLTQQEMAARVGTAREVVSRALRELERQGAVTRHLGKISAINAAMLQALIAQSGESGS